MSRQQVLRSGVRGTLRCGLVGAGLLLVGCSHPTVFDAGSTLRPRNVQACVVEQLIDHDYRIVENNRRDGFVRAERPVRFLGFKVTDEWDVIEVFIYARERGETFAQYTAARVELELGGPEFRGPRDDVEETAHAIAYACSGGY